MSLTSTSGALVSPCHLKTFSLLHSDCEQEWGKKIDKSNFELLISQQKLELIEKTGALGLDIYNMGPGTIWLRLKKTVAVATHVIKKIGMEKGGALRKIAKRPVRSILEPRIIYQW